MNENLTAKESALKISHYFSSISQEYQPLDINRLPPNIQEFLNKHSLADDQPKLSEFEVFQKIRSAKKPDSYVLGDVPKKLLKKFDLEIAVPATKIFNAITEQKKYPDQWKIEYGVPIPKTHSTPESEEDVRVISKTSFLSKCYESFVVYWLLVHIKPFLDPGQFGGLKGVSINHYMIKLLHFIHYYSYIYIL